MHAFSQTHSRNMDPPAEPPQISALLGYAVPTRSAPFGSATVDASVQPVDNLFYGHQSQALISGTPVRPVAADVPAARTRLRAKDLVAELHTINTQIHRIMFQVEKAVSRLATTG